MTELNNKPAAQVRDGRLSIGLFPQTGKNGTFFTGTPQRLYDEEREVKYADSFSGTEWLQLAQLCLKAYEEEREERERAKQQPA